jgi:hypothetical protein
LKKCLTFFTDLSNGHVFKGLGLYSSYIWLQIVLNESWFPIELWNRHDFTLTVHSANDLPDFSQTDVDYHIQLNQTVRVQYSEIQTRLLPPKYITNCYIYSNENQENHGHRFVANTRNDCLVTCMIAHFKRICNYDCVDARLGHFVSGEYFRVNNQEHLCQNIGYKQACLERNKVIVQLLCERQCPPKCVQRLFEVSMDDWEGSTMGKNNTFTVMIQHNRNADQLIIHYPEITFISFVSNLGGLIGMWLGFSAMFVGNYFIEFI